MKQENRRDTPEKIWAMGLMLVAILSSLVLLGILCTPAEGAIQL